MKNVQLKETPAGVTQKERLAGIRKMLREQFGIGVYEVEANQIQDEIIKEVMRELKQKKIAMSK